MWMGGGQVEGKDRGVSWDEASEDGGYVLLCCLVNLLLLGPGSPLLPAQEADGILAALIAAVWPRLPKQLIETLEGSRKYGTVRKEKRTSEGA